MPGYELKNMIVLLENDKFAQNLSIVNTGKSNKRGFGKEIHNITKCIVTPVHKRQRLVDSGSCETRERAKTSLALPSPNLSVSIEHQQEILHYLQKEESKYFIDKDYMLNQKDVNGKMRSILIDWLVDVCLKFELQPHILFNTVGLIDRYLEVVSIERTKLQLVGVACLMITSKFEEVFPPMLKDYLSVCDNAYSKKELLKIESDILIRMNFKIMHTSSYEFLSNYHSRLKLTEREFYFAQYILENSIFDLVHLRHSNSILAAAAIFFVNKLFKKEGWPKLYEEVTNIQEIDLKMAAKDLFIILQKNEVGELKAIAIKFSEPAFYEVSNYCIKKGGQKAEKN